MEIENRGRKRLSYIDDVRSFVIFLVVMIHASVTYSGLGSWYIVENSSETLDFASLAAFGLFNSFTQAWFMGILFFFGGFFASESLVRKGFARFVKDRLLRLGVPLLVYMFVINPLMLYFIVYPEAGRAMGSFPKVYAEFYVGKGMFWTGTGPLWFAETLLLFSLIFALSKTLRSQFARRSPKKPNPPETKDPSACEYAAQPSATVLLSLILVTAVAAFVIRVFLPIGTSWMNLQICFFASYIVLFAVGVWGATGGWFTSLAGGRNRRWFFVAVCAGIPCWIAIVLAGGALSGNIARIYGGLSWQSAAYCLWESFTAIGMSVGLPALFAARKTSREGAPRPNLSRFLSANSFSVFVFHPVFLTGLTRLFAGWALPPLLKAPIVGVLAFSSTLLFAALVVRRVPGIRKYL